MYIKHYAHLQADGAKCELTLPFGALQYETMIAYWMSTLVDTKATTVYDSNIIIIIKN